MGCSQTMNGILKFSEEKGYYADPSALSMLDIQLTKGNPQTALNGPDKDLVVGEHGKKIFWY
jgi:putative ABC transport system permease protein